MRRGHWRHCHAHDHRSGRLNPVRPHLLYSKSSVRALRTITAWVVTSSFIAGLLLPVYAKSEVADPDGVCGPVLVLAHSIEHFEVPADAPADHCVLCHLWNAMATASAADRTEVVVPDAALNDAGQSQPSRLYLSELSHSSPRGPPSLS